MDNSVARKQLGIQIIRAFAIIAVVIIHTYGSQTIGLIIRPFVNYAVALFLFLSGYLTTKQSNERLLSRITKVIFPYLVWTAVHCLAFRDVSIWNFVLARQPQTFYYIYVYIQITLLIPVSNKLMDSKLYWVGFLITPISVICLYYLPNIFNYTINEDFSRNIFLPWYSFFFLGLMTRNKGQRMIQLKKIVPLYIITIILTFGEELIWVKAFNNYSFAVSQLKITSLLSSTIVCIFAYAFIQKEKEQNVEKSKKIKAFLTQIGEYSFGIYLIHWLVRSVIIKFLPDYFETFPVLSLFVLAVSMMIIMIKRLFVREKFLKYLGF